VDAHQADQVFEVRCAEARVGVGAEIVLRWWVDVRLRRRRNLYQVSGVVSNKCE
jgi:hypothetical protein